MVGEEGCYSILALRGNFKCSSDITAQIGIIGGLDDGLSR